ncbi:hypothetical protein I6E46_05270 [Prevotella loescheii]|nr:hypothetical protein [Hoylesella loescheii]
MKKVLLLGLVLFACLPLSAQQISVKSIEELTSDLTARTHPRSDINDNSCALIKVTIPMVKNLMFSGWVMGDVDYHPGEYWVYVPEGTKKIKFQHENFSPGEIVFNIPIKKLCVYRVTLDVPEITKYATECTAFVAEGSRLFGLRDYKNAKQAYLSAIESKDVPVSMINTIQSEISICDSCISYENYALGSIKRLNELRKQGTADQEEVVRYASAAIEFLHTLNMYNPSEFYASRIDKLSSIIENMPLEIRFTTVKWMQVSQGFSEQGGMPNVELWAYYGDTPLSPSVYDSDKTFIKSLSLVTGLKLLSTTKNDGVSDILLNRTNLPRAILFRPVGYGKETKIKYHEMNSILQEAKGSYNKRQFRILIYTK